MTFRKEYEVRMRVLPQLLGQMDKDENATAWAEFQSRIATGAVMMEYGRPVYNPRDMGLTAWYARCQSIAEDRVCATILSADLDTETGIVTAAICPTGPLAAPLELLLEKQQASGEVLPFGMRAMRSWRSAIRFIVTFDALPEGFGDPVLHSNYLKSIAAGAWVK